MSQKSILRVGYTYRKVVEKWKQKQDADNRNNAEEDATPKPKFSH